MRIQTPLGTPVETTEQSIIKIDNIIIDKVGSNLDFFTSTIGSRASNRASIAITLTPANDRAITAKEIIELLKQKPRILKVFQGLTLGQIGVAQVEP